MKNLFLSLLSLILPLCCFSQEINLKKMDETTRNEYLIKLAHEVTKKFGPGYYRQDSKPIITKHIFQTQYKDELYTKNIGREYYTVTFPYDKKEELFETDYTSQVEIWEDTGEPYRAMFGNGYGIHFLITSYKEWIEIGIEEDEKVQYQQVK